jgi:hypothetical protein
MNILEQDPLLPGQFRVGSASIRFCASAVAAVNEGARIARIVKNVQCPAVREFSPHQFAFVRPPPQSPRKQEFLLTESLDNSTSGTSAAKCVVEEPNALLHLFVGIENRPALAVVYEAHGQGALQFAPARFVQDAACSHAPDHMKFCFGHGAQSQESLSLKWRGS